MQYQILPTWLYWNWDISVYPANSCSRFSGKWWKSIRIRGSKFSGKTKWSVKMKNEYTMVEFASGRLGQEKSQWIGQDQKSCQLAIWDLWDRIMKVFSICTSAVWVANTIAPGWIGQKNQTGSELRLAVWLLWFQKARDIGKYLRYLWCTVCYSMK